MSAPVDSRRALAAHLEYYRDLGVAGISRDLVWTRRSSDASTARAAASEASDDAASAVPVMPLKPSKPIDVVRPSARPVTPVTPVTPASPVSAAIPAAGDVGRDPAIVLPEIRADIGDCTRCKLHTQGRTQIVYGVGNPSADLMFVGEAPGQDEDIQGEPFVGRAGQLLTKIIEAIGLQREDVYIANVIKCRPPGNRNPEPDEVASCEPFLFRQIDAIQPRVIVALGTFAAQCLLKTNMSISRLRGRTYNYRGAQLIATFHPAFLLRSPERKRDTWEDMKKVRALLRGDGDDA